RGEGAATVTSWRAGPRGTSRCASVEAQVFVESASESTSGASITVPGYALGARILRRRGRSRRRRRTEPAGAAVHDPRPPRDGGRPSLLVPAELRRLRIAYWGFDGRRRLGELVVRDRVVPALETVFRRLYAIRFPLRRV